MVMVGITMPITIMAAEKADAKASVSGKVHVGTQVDAARMSEDIDFTYQTQDDRLGTNSGNHYASIWDKKTLDVQGLYGALLNVKLHPQHLLGITLDGKHDWESILGTRTEIIYNPAGTCISQVKGSYDHPQDKMSNIRAGIHYAYTLPRGDSLKVGYRYHLERTDWARNSTYALDQQINEQTHHVHMDYICRIAKGHALDMGIAYDRRQIDMHTQQYWDQQCQLDAQYRHLTQYGGIYARYRLKIGSVSALAGIEYRATKMQQRWLHDWIPTAMLRYQIDSVHALTGGYRMLIIRPNYSQMDTTVIIDAYTRSFGNNDLIGVHVHNTNLSYQMKLPQLTFAADIRYITAHDGLNALWMERNNVRIYTWGNQGIRHAVGLTPSIDSHIGTKTRLRWAATILWDERIAEAISMSNANWGISTKLRLEFQLPYAMQLALHGDYAYHNTLDLYSYAGHGGQTGVDWKMAFLQRHNLVLQLGYTCRFTPDIHIVQGGWTGWQTYHPSCIHQAELKLSYSF